MHRYAKSWILLAAIAALCQTAEADIFGSGNNTFGIEFVNIGNPGNAPDTMGIPNSAGSVAYSYRIGKFEVSEEMVNKAKAEAAADGNSLDISIDTRGSDKPATSVSWFEAAKYANWLNTSTENMPAYKFDSEGNFQVWTPSDPGYDSNNLYRNSLAKYFLPSADEWYKAAYCSATCGNYTEFPTGSDIAPAAVASGTESGTAVYNVQPEPADISLAGGLSPHGTMGQGGNVWEWEETDSDLVNDTFFFRAYRGGSWQVVADGLSSSNRPSDLPSFEHFSLGFRVASTLALSILPSDFDGDHDVDGFDFLKWQRGESPNPFSAADLALWEANYGMVAALSKTSTAVPEPHALTLGLLATVELLYRRRDRSDLKLSGAALPRRK